MIYLDNAATTRPSAAAVRAAQRAMEQFGNPSSMHRLGLEAEKLVKQSRSAVAGVLGVDAAHIYFTSGGTEANNTAVLGAANLKHARHAITTKIEHASVLAPFKLLEEQGFEVTYLDVNENGQISLEQFEAALRPDTALVSVMHVNNETGAIQPVEQLKPMMKAKAPRALLHVDGVQGFGKYPLKPRQWGIDLLTVSAHKIHGLKGTGALYTDKTTITPLIQGGGQQAGFRSGTENVVGIAAFGAAAAETALEDHAAAALRERLKNGILEHIQNVRIHEAAAGQSAYVLNVSFMGIKAEILLHALEPYGIYVSTGSACSTHKPEPSHVLAAMGCSREEIMGAVRFSFSEELTIEDMDATVSALAKEVGQIRKYMR